MENLLIPQVCIDIDEAPIDVGKDDSSDDSSSESQEPEIGDDEKVKLLLEEEFLNDSQVPEELTDFEKKAKMNVFAVGEPAVQFQRLHCTACNVHLGSAPIGYFNRYIHPLLKVLLCKPCYDFYCSGEFDKDEDGSEMYCRWCGQGGKVMCCAQCAYVFCQKCVRQNLGKRTLEIIKDSDDWLCFGCNPTQLINLKIICTTLYEFVRKEIRLSKSLNNIERLKIDHSMCCQKVKAAKRKRDEDTPYTPHTEWKEAKSRKISFVKSIVAKPVVPDSAKIAEWDKKEQAEVVCTPDLLALMEDDPPPLTPAPKDINKPTGSTAIPETNAKTQITPSVKPTHPEGKKIYTIAPKTMMVCNSNNFQKNSGNFVRFQSPSIKFLPSVNKLVPIVNSIPAQILPGTKHEWYDKAAAVISTITTNLSVTLTNLTKEQRNAKSVEQLANVHNKLQELLSSSVNSLIQVRKNLRTEFLDDLNKLKFSNSYYKNNNRIAPKPTNIPHAKNENGDDDDDDVIVITSESSSVTPLTEPPPLVKISSTPVASKSRPYLKVRSVSQLLTVSSECITIPDDPPGSSTIEQDVIPVEDDLLEISSDIPDQCTLNGNKNKDEVPVMKDSAEFNGIDIVNKNNALVEERIQQLVLENMKLQVSDIPQEELKRVLSVRVLISTNFEETLPSNRLKNSAYSPNITETDLNINETLNENQENQCELTSTSQEPNVTVINIQEYDDNQQTHAIESESLSEENTEKNDGRNTPVRKNQDCIYALTESLPSDERSTVSPEEANLTEETSPIVVNQEEANLEEKKELLDDLVESQDCEKNVNPLVSCISNGSESNSNEPECNVLSTKDSTINFENGNENN